MARKKSGKDGASTADRPDSVVRSRLPEELEERLKVVWQRLGHLVDWCDSEAAWTKSFYSEARPYRQTFYWEAVAEMVSSYLLDHPTAPPEGTLTDCLIATQCPSSADEGKRLSEFRKKWGDHLQRSRAEIELFIQADLELAAREGTYEVVARLYAVDYQKLREGQLLPDSPG